MNKLLILGLIIILIISLVYKVYTRKTIEGNLSQQEQIDEIENNLNNYPEIIQDVLNYYNVRFDNLNDQQKIDNTKKDIKISQDSGITTSQSSTSGPDDVTNDRTNVMGLPNVGSSRLEEIQKVENIKEENIYSDYTTSDFMDVNCNTCDDVKNAYGDIGCALYYKPDDDSSKLTLYYKKTDEAYNIKVSDDFQEEKITNNGHLITKRAKCKEIKSLEKCKNVNSCSDIRGSVENRSNCVVCEEPISNGTYEIYETYPNEDTIKSIPGKLKIQKGFPKDWESKGYKCKQDYGPFDLEGCKRGVCNEDNDPPGPNTSECYSELYKNNGGVGPPINKEWWDNNAMTQQTMEFNGYVKESENEEFGWTNPPNGNFQKIVANITSKTNIEKEDYDSAKKAYIFKNGSVDKNKIQEFACTHQERTDIPNIDCQLNKEKEVGLKPSAEGSFYKGQYNIEQFSNLMEGYSCTNTNAVSYINSGIGGKINNYFINYLKDLSMNFSTLSYENKLQDVEQIKNLGRGDKKQAALQVFGYQIDNKKPKKGDHVKFSLNNQIVKGVVVEIENKVFDINGSRKTMALCMWDYYKGNNVEYYRTGYSVCNEENFKLENDNKVYNNSDCIDGVTSMFDTGRTKCPKNNLSCELINNAYNPGNLGSYKYMSGSLMEEMLKDSIYYTPKEKILWKDEGWIDIDELERLHICQGEKCKKGYFSCDNTVKNYINL